ncbi:hypothetical protein KC717_00345 [Candidatus Dojkabacteria bacterium]|uniref:Uncharacterized protein n=1 Tax=Candidatus Dojkabacteria bacterium TaxID=2099670 RepID=A0A955RJT5_9BACT|nr:hypothetical protein [Candidatus Dojkabacteria bacterium]
MSIFEKQINDREHTQVQGNEQLALEIKAGKLEGWYAFKHKLSSIERLFENLPFWRVFVNGFSIVTILMTMSICFFALYTLWPKIPDLLPLFYSQNSANWALYPRESMILLVGIITGIELVVFYTSFKIFSFDRRLAIVLNSLIIMTCILFLIAYSQLLALVLV